MLSAIGVSPFQGVEEDLVAAQVDPEVVALLNDRWESYERGQMPARSWDKIRSEIRRS